MDVSREYVKDQFPYFMGVIKGRGYELPEEVKDWELYDIFESLDDNDRAEYITFLYNSDVLNEAFIKQVFDLSSDKEVIAHAIKLYSGTYVTDTVKDFVDFGLDKKSLVRVLSTYEEGLDFERIVDVAKLLEDLSVVKKLMDKSEDAPDAYEIEDLLSIFEDDIYEDLLPYIEKLKAADKKYILEQWG